MINPIILNAHHVDLEQCSKTASVLESLIAKSQQHNAQLAYLDSQLKMENVLTIQVTVCLLGKMEYARPAMKDLMLLDMSVFLT